MMTLLTNDLKTMAHNKRFLCSVVIASPLMILLFNTASFAISYATFLSSLFALSSIVDSEFSAKEKVCFALMLGGSACLFTTLLSASANQFLHATPVGVLVETGAGAILLTGFYNFLALTALMAVLFPLLCQLEKRYLTTL